MERKKTCPLCKRPLQKIIYDVKSPSTYKLVQFDTGDESNHDIEDDIISSATTSSVSPAPFFVTQKLFALFGHASESISPFVRRFHLDDTQIPERIIDGGRPWRRFCYEYNLFAFPSERPNMQAHHSLAYYRNHADQLVEMKNWLAREMHALSDVIERNITEHEIETICQCVEELNIDSLEFHAYLPPLTPKSEHFIHEMISFAQSAQNINTYDADVKYDFRDDGASPVPLYPVPNMETPTVRTGDIEHEFDSDIEDEHDSSTSSDTTDDSFDSDSSAFSPQFDSNATNISINTTRSIFESTIFESDFDSDSSSSTIHDDASDPQ